MRIIGPVAVVGVMGIGSVTVAGVLLRVVGFVVEILEVMLGGRRYGAVRGVAVLRSQVICRELWLELSGGRLL